MGLKTRKKFAWEAFSTYIRFRDCLLTTGKPEKGKFCTCGKEIEFEYLQAGHWLPRRHNSVLFDERNCHAQCFSCNIGKKGNPVKYFHFMEKKYGREVMEELERLDTEPKQFKEYEMIELKKTFERMTRDLRKVEGICGT